MMTDWDEEALGPMPEALREWDSIRHMARFSWKLTTEQVADGADAAIAALKKILGEYSLNDRMKTAEINILTDEVRARELVLKDSVATWRNAYELLEAKVARLKGYVRMALDELGVPTEMYPAPVANAVEFLNECFKADLAARYEAETNEEEHHEDVHHVSP